MGAVFRGIDRIIVRLSDVFVYVAAFLLALMALIGTADVLSLNFLGKPVPAATEFASSMLPIAVMLVMSYAQRNRAHISVELFSRFFPGWFQWCVSLLALLIGAVVFVLLSWGAWELAQHSFEIRERAVAAIRFPVWPVKVAFLFGMVVCALEMVREIVVHVAGLGRSRASGSAVGGLG